jgi:hypothetical protein
MDRAGRATRTGSIAVFECPQAAAKVAFILDLFRARGPASRHRLRQALERGQRARRPRAPPNGGRSFVPRVQYCVLQRDAILSGVATHRARLHQKTRAALPQRGRPRSSSGVDPGQILARARPRERPRAGNRSAETRSEIAIYPLQAWVARPLKMGRVTHGFRACPAGFSAVVI